MKLTVLMDNNTYIDRYFLGEPAFSVYIEDGDERILFDTGYSDAFIRNAEQMQIDLGAPFTKEDCLAHSLQVIDGSSRKRSVFWGNIQRGCCTPATVFPSRQSVR